MNHCTCDIKPDGSVRGLHGDYSDHVGDRVTLHDGEGKQALIEGQWSGTWFWFRDPFDVQAASGCLLGPAVIHCLDLKTYSSEAFFMKRLDPFEKYRSIRVPIKQK